MWLTRSPFRSGRIPLLLLGLGVAAIGPAAAQTDSKSAPSPVAPGDLSKPVFDTTTPAYGSVAGPDKAAGTIVAEVEGRPITLGDVGDTIRALPATLTSLPFATLYPSVLDQLIRLEALVVRAQQRGIDEDPTVRRRVRAAADRALSEEFLKQEVFKGITEEALLQRYNQDFAGRPGEEEVRVRVILAGSEKEAADLIAEIKGGADIAAVARRASKDSTASAGGDLGFQTREKLNPAIGPVAFALGLGEVTAFPVRSGSDWFVVKTEDRREQPTPSFGSVREQLRNGMLQEGAGIVTASALQGLKVRKYDFTGAEVKAGK